MSFLERPRYACVLGGALATITSLPGIVPIVHAAQGCAGNLSAATFAGSGYLGAGYCGGHSIPSSNVLEKDIVFGGMERLEEEIDNTLDIIDAQAFIVTTSCMTEIIGDDIKGALEKYKAAPEAPPIFHVDTAGFAGNSYTGYEKVIRGLFENLIDKRDKHDPKRVNLFGIIPVYDPHFRGELEEIERILESLGLNVNTFFTANQTLDALKNAGEASLNICFSRVYAVEALRAVEATHGIPLFVTDLPVGALATDAFIDELGQHINIPKRRAAEVKGRENARYYRYFDGALDLYADSDFQQYAALVTNANRAIPYSRFLVNEIGWILKYAYVTDELDETQKRALEASYHADALQTNPKLTFETNTNKIAVHLQKSLPPLPSGRYYDAFAPAFILGSSLEKELSATLNAGLLTVSYPIMDKLIMDRSYAGYSGGIHLFEDLVSKFVSVR